jgi:hypothetical protein
MSQKKKPFLFFIKVLSYGNEKVINALPLQYLHTNVKEMITYIITKIRKLGDWYLEFYLLRQRS